MLKLLVRAFAITLGLIGPAMAQQRVLISLDWGKATAELMDNNATRALIRIARRRAATRFSTGPLGLWSSNHFVIYYRDTAEARLASAA